PAFRQCRPIYAQAILATLVINTLALAMPLFTMNVYDRVLPNAAEATLWALGFGVLLAIVLDFILRTLRAYFVDAASRSADVRLSNLIYARLLGAQTPKAIQSTGVRANTMREFETLREFFNSATLTAFGDLPFLLLFVAVIYYVAGPLAWLVLAAIPVVLFVAWLTQRALQRLIAVSFQQTAQKNAVVTETLAGLETIKVAGGESWAARKWEASVAEHVRTGLKIRQVTNLGQHTIQMIQTAVQVLIVFAGFYLIQAGEMTMGALIAATILSGRALAPLAQAATLLVRANQARIAYATLNEFVTAPQERRYTREAQTKHRPTDQGLSNNHVSQRKSGGGQLHCGMIVPSQWAGEINFEDVTFRYDDEAAPALDAVSLRIGPGERVGLLGPIGSGKSTALKLIHGIYRPDAGRVLIDQFAVSQLDPSELRSNVGLLLQGGDLFHGTLRENITMGAAGVDDTALIDAIKTAGAAGWIGRLPLGLDTLIRERGAGLSGGQRQSIALARACLGEPKILLLDEPTSDMDARTEATVLQRLKATLNNRTLLIVTHRPAPLELVDRLIVFDSGRVLHDGNKASVLKDLREQPATKSVRQTIHVGEKLKSLAKKRGEESHDA
ncbi:MAG: ABC transporter transmembrane domain-containing protein, partial [Pseudomonadota bacterium]